MVNDNWPTISREVEFQCEWFEVGYDLVRQPNDELQKYYWVSLSDDVVIVARNDNKLVLINEYWPYQQEVILSCPGGAIQENEDQKEAALRELREETGYIADSVEIIQTHRYSGLMRAKRTVVFADELHETNQKLDNGEFISVQEIPIKNTLDSIRNSTTSGWTTHSILLAEEQGLL